MYKLCIYLHAFGGIKLSRPSASVHAARVRAAWKTFSGFSEMHELLVKKALEANPLCRAIQGDFSPMGWNHKAFCTNLHEAFDGVIVDNSFGDCKAILARVKREYDLGKIKKRGSKVESKKP